MLHGEQVRGETAWAERSVKRAKRARRRSGAPF
jgi:hypothetical protein